MSQMGGTFVASVPAVPVGVMEAFAGSSAPTGWLLCNGTTASRTTYSNLYSVIGTTYGVGDGSTTFGLPDMRGRVPMGAGTGNQLNASGSGAITGGTGMTARTAGAFGGEETHLLTSAEMPAHTHSPNGQATFLTWDGGSLGVASGGGLAQAVGSPATTGSTGGGGRHAVVPPFVVLNYIIKAIPDTPRGGMTATFTPPIVTSLPLVPQFGDQVVYAADAANGVYWLLQYDATGTYPWKFIGGAPLYSENTGSQAYTTTAGNYQDWVTRSVPLAGDYTAEGSCGLTTTSGNDTIVLVTPSAARAQTYQLCRQSNAASQYEKGYTKARFPALAASATLAVSIYSVAAGSGATLNNGTLYVTPIQVKAA